MISRTFLRQRIVAAAAVLTVAAIGAGCQSKKTPTPSAGMPLNASVTDISPTPTGYQPTQPVQPIQPIQPVMIAQQPVEAGFATGGSSGGGSYTVQKGDTLYKIAREKYGDAKQWKKIAAANPEAANGLIKPGQKLIIP